MMDKQPMEDLFQITRGLCKTFDRAAKRHRKKMGKALKKAKILDGGKEIRIPMNYGKEEE